MSKDVRVLIIDDSFIVRQMLSKELGRQAGIDVIGTAPDPFVAREKILELNPDVLTLDIDLPKMDGLTFLRKLMKFMPMPVIIVSSQAQRGCDTAISCLEAGAIDVVGKPSESYSVGEMTIHLGELIRGARKINFKRESQSEAPPQVVISTKYTEHEPSNRVIAIGSSTGGTEALHSVLSALPPTIPGLVIVQHMPAGFTKSFAERLNDLCTIEVREAIDGDIVKTGCALLAPGGFHVQLARRGTSYYVKVSDGPRVKRHKPSVEVLFETTARYAGENAMGIIMTGMGNDGAEGLLAMRKSGAVTVGQDEESCVVYGMPQAAFKCGAVQVVKPLTDIPDQIIEYATNKLKAAAA